MCDGACFPWTESRATHKAKERGSESSGDSEAEDGCQKAAQTRKRRAAARKAAATRRSRRPAKASK